TVAALGPTELPNLYRLIDEGASTLNARTMFDATQTLPNHTSMMTGLPVLGADGHQVTFNEDDGTTVHNTAGRYIAGVFGVVHDAGLATALYAGKPKFDFLDRSWDATNGAPDTTGADDGTDKLDTYQRGGGATTTASFVAAMGTTPFDLSFVHYADPDAAGHDSGWTSSAYDDAVRTVDGYVGQILGAIEADSDLDGETYVILTSDHGGIGTSHGDSTALENATIPFFVWGPGATGGADLYDLNTTTRVNPGATIPDHAAVGQPVRNADTANLALSLLNLGPVPGSVINPDQDLAIDGEPVADDPPMVQITSPTDGATVGSIVSVTAMATDDVAVASVDFRVGGVSIGTDVDGSDGWSQQWDTGTGSDGSVSVSAVATDSIGQTASDAVGVTVDNDAPASVVMVVSNPASLTSSDAAVHGHLLGAGYSVQLLDDGLATPADANGASFVFIASSIHSYTLGDTFADVAAPVWVAKPWLLDDMDMTGPAGGIDYGTVRSSTITIVDSGHPLSAGLNGDVAVNAGGRTMSFGVPGGSGEIVSTAAGSSSTFVYQLGGTLADGSTAAGCRVHSSVFNTAVLGWTADAWALFDAAAAYAAGGCTPG
ncbi:MAG: sulfatase-like hydrolase/transferase, partial [bacterium]|nr:sulfatase-like hydrolase/transferase [bacterium]